MIRRPAVRACDTFHFGAMLAALFGCACVPAAAGPDDGPAVTGVSCAVAFHAALAGLNATQGNDVSNAVAALRAADPNLPGHWIYSEALLGKPFRMGRPRPELRPCVASIRVAGRVHCTRFGAVPAAQAELDISPPPTPAELQLLKAVGDLVEGRGAVPDVGNNGRYRWLAERSAADIKTYISQPPHAAICAGAGEVAEFYATALKPLEKRIAGVGALVAAARAAAVARVVVVAAPAAPPGAAPPAASSVQPVVRPAEDEPPKPLIALVADAVRPVVAQADIAAILAENTALAALQRAKPALLAAQASALASGDPGQTERVLVSGRAVRMLEVAAYAEIYAARYARFAATVLAMPEKIEALHKGACTCGN